MQKKKTIQSNSSVYLLSSITQLHQKSFAGFMEKSDKQMSLHFRIIHRTIRDKAEHKQSSRCKFLYVCI